MELSYSRVKGQFKVAIDNSWFYLTKESVEKVTGEMKLSQQFVTLLFRTLVNKDSSLELLLSTLS